MIAPAVLCRFIRSGVGSGQMPCGLLMLHTLFDRTATGFGGPVLGGTAAYVAIAGTFAGDGMGYGCRPQRKRRQGAHDDSQIHARKQGSQYVSQLIFH